MDAGCAGKEGTVLTMRGLFGLGASALAGLAVQPPFKGLRRWLARALALLWLFAAIWIAVLLLWYRASVRASDAPPGIEQAYLGLTASVYHLVGLYEAFSWCSSPRSGRWAGSRSVDRAPMSGTDDHPRSACRRTT